MKIFYTDHFVLPLPAGHRFPMSKYGLLRERVQASGLVPPHELVSPAAATTTELRLVHDRRYIEAVTSGALTNADIRRIGFPWSEALVARSLRSVGGTIGAARAALVDGVSVNLAGGTHHAFPDKGEGFCVFNDVAVATRVLQKEGRIRRVAIIDTDVHQGNGTARVFRHDNDVFTFSVHGQTNFPFRKERSDLDIALEDGAGDDEYLAALSAGLDAAFSRMEPDLIFHVAGADPFEGDLLGRLHVSMSALAQRDDMLVEASRTSGAPLAVVMAGGYAARVDDTVSIHYHSVAAAAALGRGEPEAISR